MDKGGLTIVDVADGSPAYEAGMSNVTEAGLRVARWEVHAVNGKKVGSDDEFQHALEAEIPEFTLSTTVFIEVCRFSEGQDPVGFLEFLSPGADAECAVADVIADPDPNGEGAVTARIGREDFGRTVGEAKDVFHQVEASSKYQYYQAAKNRGQRRFTLCTGSPQTRRRMLSICSNTPVTSQLSSGEVARKWAASPTSSDGHPIG